MNAKLSKLLKDIQNIPPEFDKEISGLSSDSRKIKSGDVFCAYKGYTVNGNDFILDAMNNGAKAILTDSPEMAHVTKNSETPIIFIDSLKYHLSAIAADFYKHPSKDITIIGVTGTNGKTSVCHYLAQALHLLGEKVAIMGTLGNGIYGEHHNTGLTTADPITLQAELAKLKEEGVKYLAMEVSSHGLAQGRVSAIDIDIAIFTNLSRDHLDYHGDMLAYGEAKKLLFKMPSVNQVICNIDDEFGRQLVEEFQKLKETYTYSIEGRHGEFSLPSIWAQHTHLNLKGTTASVHTPWGDGLLHTKLLGAFNLSNILAVNTALGSLGISQDKFFSILAQVNAVNGRMELLGGEDKPSVVIDFAHTPDALKQVLQTLREYTESELWCVFGCGGNRDQGKRALMGQIAETYADQIVLTDDNPRNENPADIVADILQSMNAPERVVVEHNRARAIAHAMTCAKMGDIILIAGKGHEAYQIYGDKHLEFSDEIEVKLLLAER